MKVLNLLDDQSTVKEVVNRETKFGKRVFSGTLTECRQKKVELNKARADFVTVYKEKCPGKCVTDISYEIY